VRDPDLTGYIPLTLPFRRKYEYTCSIEFKRFLNWKKGEVREIKIGQWRKRWNKLSSTLSNTTYEIPAAYHQLICQLVAEDMHAEGDNSHESCRRQTYARETLDALGDELKEYKRKKLPPVDFRSKILTPILQRYLHGVYDGYSPSVTIGISKDEEALTIQHVTKFYLGVDPADPIFIRTYHRNLVYLPHARWHLGVVMGAKYGTSQGASENYDNVYSNHYAIMADLNSNDHESRDANNIPLLKSSKVRCIIQEGLENFFQEEFERIVSDILHTHLHLLTNQPHSPM